MQRSGKYRQCLIRLLAGTIFSLLAISVSAQLGIPIETTGQDRISDLYSRAKLYHSEGRSSDALNLLEEALQLAMIDNEPMELKILEFMGDVFHQSESSAQGIPYYLRTMEIMESNSESTQLPRIYEKIASAYRAEEVHSKEQEYYEKVLELLPESEREQRLEMRTRIGSAAYHGRNYERAILTFTALKEEYERGGETWLNIHQDLVTVHDAAGQYDSALYYCEVMLPFYLEKGDEQAIIRLTNNMGYYTTLLGDFQSASAYYADAIESSEKTGVKPEELASMKSNAGVCYTNLGEEKEAIRQFNEAIEILDSQNSLAEKSRNENMLANVYYKTGDLYNAALFCRQAIVSARKALEPWNEAQAYLSYSNVLRDGNDPVNALVYYEKYLAIRDSIEFARRIRIQTLENRKNELEKEERNLQLRLKEEEVSELAIRQLRLQNEQIEQEKELLMRDRNLAMLKEDSLRLSMEVKDQANLLIQQKAQNRLLEQEKELAALQLKEQERLKEAAERDKLLSDQKLQLAELEAQRQKLEAQRQAADKKALIRAVIGAGVLSLLILASLISSRRKNYLLAKQKEELEQKNEEISAQRDEIEAQRNLVFDQKQEIEAVNSEIVKSIEYAKRLQTAALPVLVQLDEKVADQFVFFRPRDVVSGDFFWFAEVEDKLVISVADCTGHGVPGAFMSMMGMSLLKELVQKEYITHPGVILRRLRKEIINTMGQKGISGEQRDGMDMSLIAFDPSDRSLNFAGAYNSLYIVRHKDQPAPNLENGLLEPDQMNGQHYLYEVPADKMPIAHFERMDKFKNHELEVRDGDTLYMFTDGFPDQFGGPKGKKFMYKPFKKLLLNISQKPMQDQHDILSKTLDEWMGDISQVDDICVMGLRL